MGLRGPKPKPAAILSLHGSRLAGERTRREAKFGRAITRCPRHLDPHAKELWRKLAPVLREARILSAGDLTALEVLCCLYSDLRHAREQMAKHGQTVTTESGFTAKSAWRQIADRACRDLLSYMSTFGLTPSSRAGAATVDDAMGGLIMQQAVGGKYY